MEVARRKAKDKHFLKNRVAVKLKLTLQRATMAHRASRNITIIGLSDCSVRKIMHKNLNFNPYKNTTVQVLSGRDMANRKDFLSNFTKC